MKVLAVPFAQVSQTASDGQIHLTHLISGVGVLLPVNGHLLVAVVCLHKFYGLHEHTAGTTAGFYKDVIFDKSLVAGKVYVNSENRREQGVPYAGIWTPAQSIIKSLPKLNSLGKIKKYNYTRIILIRAFNNTSISSSVLDFPRDIRTVPLA